VKPRLLIIAAALVCVFYFRRTDDSQTRDSSTVFQMYSLHNAINLYQINCGHYPNTNRWIEALLTNDSSPGWSGPYLEMREGNITNLLADEWGTPFVLMLDRRGEAKIISAGPDRNIGTEDDLWK
jgi:general secretion pathway protein G